MKISAIESNSEKINKYKGVPFPVLAGMVLHN
jgi:hypothetical protein